MKDPDGHSPKKSVDKTKEELVAEARLKLSSISILKISTIIYGSMVIIGLAIIHFGHKNTAELFRINMPSLEWLRLGAIGLLAAFFLKILSYFFEDWFESYRVLKHSMTQMIGPTSVGGALYLAAISSIGEEILFRGAIQPFAGVVITSILFGYVHLGKEGKVNSWTIWAMFAGLLLGLIQDATQTLWAPIFAHFLVNAYTMIKFRTDYKKWQSTPSSKVENKK